MKKQHQEADIVGSLTRLALGGVLLAHDELQRQIRLWEDETRYVLDSASRPPNQQPLLDQGEQSQVVEEAARVFANPHQPVASLPDQARYALLGIFFDVQDRLAPFVPRPAHPVHSARPLLNPLARAFYTNPALGPVRKQFDALVSRGEIEVERWVERGRLEEQHSRVLAHNALQLSTHAAIHNVVENPEVRELVQKQGFGLADEVIEEVRERAVSVDTYLERLIRVVLRRKPREDLPAPSDVVRDYVHRLKSARE